MELSGIAATTARIQEIGQQIAAAQSFSALLARAQTNLPVAATPTGVPPLSNPPVPTATPSAAPGNWAHGLPPQGRAWADEIEQVARKVGLDPRLLASLVWTESGFNPTAGSSAGAIGLTQLMPGTAAGLGVNPHDPLQNLEGGARYLKQQLDNFGRIDLALAAYNAGPGRVQEAGGIPNIPETQAYVQRVLGFYQQLGGSR